MRTLDIMNYYFQLWEELNNLEKALCVLTGSKEMHYPKREQCEAQRIKFPLLHEKAMHWKNDNRAAIKLILPAYFNAYECLKDFITQEWNKQSEGVD